MKLMYKINLVALTVLVVVGLAIAAAGLSTISRVIYDLNRELMSREVDNVVATIQDAYEVLVENRLDGVESYNRQAQIDVVSELDSYRYGETGLLIIVTSDKKVVKHAPLKVGQQCNLPHLEAMVSDRSGTMEFSYAGQQRFFSYKLFPQWNWLVILSVTSEEMLAARSQFVGLVVGILLISLVFGALVFVWFIRRVVGPIRQLAGATTYVSEGKWDTPLPQPTGSDEIAQLTTAFHRMAGRLAQMYGSLEENLQQIESSRSALRQSEEQYKSLYKEAKETEERYHSLIGSTLDAIVIYDINGHTTYVNNAFTQMFGWKLEEVLDGVPYVPESDRETTMQYVKEVSGDGLALKDVETKRLTKEGKLVDVSISASRYNDHQGNPAGMLVILRDITQRKQAMEELRKHRDHLEELVNARTVELATSKEQAEAANAAKSDFLARMSHEIRTPLNAVIGLTNIVLKSKLTAEQHDYLNKVQMASNNLLEIINDILDFSKVEAGRLELEHHPFDLDQIMEQLADIFSEQIAEKNLELIFAVNPSIPRQLKGDSVRLAQVLINLIQNSVKFTQNGEIVVGVEQKHTTTKGQKQTVFKFWVRDTGTGVAADTLPNLFEPFTQAEGYLTRKHEGSGLGLAICRRLVELMGGRIWAESTPDLGSTFSFTVLLETQKEEKPQLSMPAELQGLKALVVDDNTDARQVIADILEYLGFNVTAVESGEKAVETLDRAATSAPYQLVLMDWKMPGMNGIETAAAINDNPDLQQLPIIMITAYEHELAQKGIDTTVVNTMLLKPIKPAQLFNAIMNLLGQGQTMVPQPEQQPDVQPLHRLAGGRVLVVEDSELNRDVAAALLEEAGLTVEIAENGKVAVDKVAECKPGYYHMVLMDIQMPEMDGYQATRHIREWESNTQSANNRIPIIALTAHALKGEKEKCLAAEMDDYLAKPLDEQDLYRMLLKWIVPQQVEKNKSNSF